VQYFGSAVQEMVNAGSTTLRSDRISTSKPDAYLLLKSCRSGEVALVPETNIPQCQYWRDVACPLEYKFGDGDKDDVSQSPVSLAVHCSLLE
jgi:hypothetical protein